jgi:hypothetical protein
MSDVTLVKWSAGDGSNTGNNGNTTNNNTTNNNTTNNGGSRPVNNYYYYGDSDTGGSTSTSSTPTQNQPGVSNQNDGRVVDASGGSGATSIEEPPTPQVGPSDGAADSDALLSGGVFISTRALVGIIFGLAALALLALLIIRLTARRKDVLHD